MVDKLTGIKQTIIILLIKLSECWQCYEGKNNGDGDQCVHHEDVGFKPHTLVKGFSVCKNTFSHVVHREKYLTYRGFQYKILDVYQKKIKKK